MRIWIVLDIDKPEDGSIASTHVKTQRTEVGCKVAVNDEIILRPKRNSFNSGLCSHLYAAIFLNLVEDLSLQSITNMKLVR